MLKAAVVSGSGKVPYHVISAQSHCLAKSSTWNTSQIWDLVVSEGQT
jgi:hypothetical protein